MSHISPTHCPGNRGYLLFFSMVTVSCMKSSQGGGGELRVQSQQCMVSIRSRTQAWQALSWNSQLWSKKGSQVCVLSAVRKECAYGKVLGFMLVGSAVVA